MKLKIYRIIQILLIIATAIIAVLVIKKFYKSHKNDNLAKEIIQTIQEEQKTESNKIEAEMKGYKVIGIIKIPKIELEYPILETTSIDSLNVSITKFWGNDINEIGNVTLAGHNNLNGVMFGKIKKLNKGDIIELTDIQNITLKYEVFDIKVIDPNDISCILPIEQGRREVTLITCTNGRKNRLIVKAKEVI